MNFNVAQITKLSRETRFSADNLEKVIRLRELLIELHKHPFLQGKLVLKGGTAINLFYLSLARLSVDIDLNYIGHVDREAALDDRHEVVKAVEQVASGLHYRLQNGVDEHALREWRLSPTPDTDTERSRAAFAGESGTPARAVSGSRPRRHCSSLPASRS